MGAASPFGEMICRTSEGCRGAVVLKASSGKTVKAEGLLQTNEDGSVTYYVREDKVSRSAEKIYRHEKFHQFAQNKAGLMADLVRLLESKYGTQELAALVNRYAEAYDGIYGRFDESMTADEQEELVMLYMEEVFADAYAGIKRGSRSIRSAQDVLQSRTGELETTQENLRGMQSQNAPPGQKFSIREIRGEKGDYGEGVLLDTDLFDGIHPRNWGRKLRQFVYNNLAGSELTMYDENGNPESVYVAKKNDRVKKDGANNDHKVIDELARGRGDNIRSLATVHLSEALLASGNETSTDEHNHQWMDENGWRYRTVYLQDVSGNIYTATLNIANGRNSRNILYDINNIRKVDNGKREVSVGVVPSTVSGRGSHESTNFSSQTSIQQKSRNVKQKFSVEEETAEMDEAASRIAQQDPILEETRTEVDPAAAEKKRQKAEAKSISQLKNGIKSAQQAIATQTAAKVALRNAGQLTAEVKTMIDNKIEDIRQTLRIEQAALKQKQAAQEKEEKKKKQAEIEMQTAEQKARTAQKELRQDLLNLFSVKAGRRSETAQAIDAISDELLRSGKITHESRKALIVRLCQSVIAALDFLEAHVSNHRFSTCVHEKITRIFRCE